MFEDIIGEIRHIEILHNGYNGVWKLARMKKLKPGFTFRYVDRPEVHYRAAAHPVKNADGTWYVLGEMVED